MLNKHLQLTQKISGLRDDSCMSEPEYDMSGIITNASKEELVNDVAERFEIKTGSLKARGRNHSNSMRSTESKSLDNLLQNRRQETGSKIKRRIGGSSKFYVNKPNRKQIFSTGMVMPLNQSQKIVINTILVCFFMLLIYLTNLNVLKSAS